MSSRCELWPQKWDLGRLKSPKLSTPRPLARIFPGVRSWPAEMGCAEPANSCLSCRKWAGRCQKGKSELATGPKCDDPDEGGVPIQICKLGPKSTSIGTQNAKVVYPPPPKRQITGVHDREPEMSCVWPAKPGLSRPTLPKMGPNRPIFRPKRGQQREKRGALARK